MTIPKKQKLAVFALISLIVILSPTFLGIAFASQLQIKPGQVLRYTYGRMSTSDQGQGTGDVLYRVLDFNAKTLTFQIEAEGDQFSYTINYENGYPVSIDRLEALMYLPPESISQSSQGNNNWTSNIRTNVQQKVTGVSSQVLNYTVEAGSFQTVNVTLVIAAPWDSGNLTLLYDINSGILVYTHWIPMYGDIIVQYLSSTDFVLAPKGMIVTVLSAVLSLASFGIPVILAAYQARKRIRTFRSPNPEVQASNVMKSSFPKKAFILASVGGLLNIASLLLPWSQTRDVSTYLALSLPSAINPSVGTLSLSFSFTLFSIVIHAVAILSWLAIALYAYKTRKLTPQIVALSSAIIAFASIAYFVLSGWTYAWGFWTAVAGAALTLISLAVANIRITIEMETDQQESETSETKDAEP